MLKTTRILIATLLLWVPAHAFAQADPAEPTQTGRELLQRRDALEQQAAELSERLTRIVSEQADRRQKIEALEAQLERLRAEYEQAEADRKATAAQQQQLQAARDALEAELAALRERDAGPAAPARKLQVAVAPLRLPHAGFSFEGDRVPSADVERRLSQELVSQLVDSRRFAVLDRTYTAEVERELARLQDGRVPDEELARLGRQLGADYLVVGSLEDATIDRADGVVRLTGLPYSTYAGRVSVAMRIVDVATTQTLLADTVTLSFDDEQFRRLAALRGDTRLDDVMLWAAGDQLATRFIDAVDPVRVVEVRPDGTVVLNQGGDRFEAGDRIALFRTGRPLQDPVTGETLAVEETYTATLEITRKTPEVAYGRVVDGDAAAITRGDIARR
ncbi:MAG: CsgG/HfaB family protein [Phycisphaerae bacterium]